MRGSQLILGIMSTILTNVSGLQVNVMHRQFSFIACQYRRHFPIRSCYRTCNLPCIQSACAGMWTISIKHNLNQTGVVTGL